MSDVDRTELKDYIQENWVGKDKSNIGSAYVSMDWKTRTMKPTYPFRQDIYILNLNFKKSTDQYSIFIDRDGTYTVNKFSVKTPELLNEKYLKKFISELFSEHKEFVEKQRKWFNEKPWEQLDGKSPEEAVDILESLGW